MRVSIAVCDCCGKPLKDGGVNIDCAEEPYRLYIYTGSIKINPNTAVYCSRELCKNCASGTADFSNMFYKRFFKLDESADEGGSV